MLCKYLYLAEAGYIHNVEKFKCSQDSNLVFASQRGKSLKQKKHSTHDHFPAEHRLRRRGSFCGRLRRRRRRFILLVVRRGRRRRVERRRRPPLPLRGRQRDVHVLHRRRLREGDVFDDDEEIVAGSNAT